MKIRTAIACIVFAAMAMQAAVTPEEVLQAVDQMTPEQVHTLQRKLEGKMWKPIPEGFFTRMAVDVAASTHALDTVDLSGVALSGGQANVNGAGGMELGILWRVAGERLRLGLRFGSWGGNEANLGGGGYSRASVAGGHVSLAANYQLVRSPSWLVWTEAAPGAGGVTVETVNTPAGQPTTLREFEGGFGQLDLRAGAGWRFNPVLMLFLSGGYRFAESIELDEGGQSTDVKFDASGLSGQLGLGVNF